MQTHFAGPFGEKGRIVSLRPLNPLNTPDQWERAALQRFETGAQEVSAVDSIGGVPHLRVMKPFYTEEGCLKCHGRQGYKAGEVRGGIVVSLSLEPFYEAASRTKRHLLISHSVGWLIGLLAIGLVATRSHRRELERKAAEDVLRRSESSLAEAQRIAHLGNWELDLVSKVLTWSPEIFRIFEIDPAQFGATYEAFLAAIHPDDRAMVDRAFTDSVANRKPYDIVHRLLMQDGRVKYVNEKCETHYVTDGRPIRALGTVHDVTERRSTPSTRNWSSGSRRAPRNWRPPTRNWRPSPFPFRTTCGRPCAPSTASRASWSRITSTSSMPRAGACSTWCARTASAWVN